jgi:hypothetical protein
MKSGVTKNEWSWEQTMANIMDLAVVAALLSVHFILGSQVVATKGKRWLSRNRISQDDLFQTSTSSVRREVKDDFHFPCPGGRSIALFLEYTRWLIFGNRY